MNDSIASRYRFPDAERRSEFKEGRGPSQTEPATFWCLTIAIPIIKFPLAEISISAYPARAFYPRKIWVGCQERFNGVPDPEPAYVVLVQRN